MNDKPLNKIYSNFKGLWSKDDPGLIPSDPVNGVYASAISNVTCDDGTITMSSGYEKENNGSTETTHYGSPTNTFIRRQFLLKKRNGNRLRLAHLDSGVLEWYNAIKNRYEILLTGYGVNTDIGVIDYNKTNEDRTYIGDGVNNMSAWSKAVAYYASDNGSDQITVTVGSPATSLATAGFPSSGTIILKDGTSVTYSSISGLTFSGCSAVPSSPSVGDGIAHAVDTSTYSTQPKGKIMAVFQGRLCIVPEDNTTLVRLSAVATGSDFTSTGVSGALTLNVIDGNGRINALSVYDKRLIVMKEDGIIPVEILLLDSSTLRTNIEPFILYNNIGPQGQYKAYSGVDEVFYLSGENDIKRLSTVKNEQQVSTNVKPITDSIKPTMGGLVTTDSSVIFHDKKLYVNAAASGSTNDTVVEYDYTKDTFYFHRVPTFGFWIDEQNDLYFTSPTEVASYKMKSGYDADGGSIDYLWRTGRLSFGSQFNKKSTNVMAVFGKMTTSSVLKCRVDYNSGELGATEWDVAGDGSSKSDGTYMLTNSESNMYGALPYGISPYGGGSDSDPGQYFLFFKDLPRNFNPYDVYITFAASGVSNYIKVMGFALNPTIINEIPKRKRI